MDNHKIKIIDAPVSNTAYKKIIIVRKATPLKPAIKIKVTQMWNYDNELTTATFTISGLPTLIDDARLAHDFAEKLLYAYFIADERNQLINGKK